jgi:type IV secretory pathway TraG/TraD family ATPase VirD4
MNFDPGIYLGRAQNVDAYSGSQRSTLVLGPSRSGKTSSLIIPNLLMKGHSSVITSTKDDVLRAMSARPRNGSLLLFDPSGTVPELPGVTRIGYSPVRKSLSWDGAILVSRTLTTISRPTLKDNHWSERAAALLAPLLHVAALRGSSLAEFCSRVDARDSTGVAETLLERYGAHHASHSLLTGILATEERELSGIWSSASGLLAGMRTDAARQAADRSSLDLDKFFTGTHQLHIVAPSRFQAVTTPLIVGLLDYLVHGTYDRFHQGARLLLALDELANVAPLPQLASIVSEGGGQGVLTLACLQDLSQARARWGEQAQGFLSLFASTVVLPGIADRATLEIIRNLGGTYFQPQRSLHRPRRGRGKTSTTSWHERSRLTIAQIAAGRPGYALGLTPTKEARWIKLTPWFNDPRFSSDRTLQPMAQVLRTERPRSEFSHSSEL